MGGGGLNLISGNLYGVSGRGEARLRLCCSCCTRDLTNLVIKIIVFVIIFIMIIAIMIIVIIIIVIMIIVFVIIVFVIIVIMIIANRMRIFMCSYGVQHLAI